MNPDCDYWAKGRVVGGWQVELAGATLPEDWSAWASALFGGAAPAMALSDRGRGVHRFAFTEAGHLTGALFISSDPVRLARGHLAGLLGLGATYALAGRPGADMPDPGPTVCACLNVGLNTILDAIHTRGILSVEALGVALGAGTNCGSCRPELAALLQGQAQREAAE